MNRLTRGKALVGALHIDAQDITISDDLVVGDDASVTGDATVGTLAVGGGTVIKKVTKGTGSVDLASITNGETGSGTFTVTGAAVGDVIVVNPPALTTGLAFAGAAVTGANTVTVYAVNASAAPIDQAEATFTYLWVDVT
jgi:hypothetical protein